MLDSACKLETKEDAEEFKFYVPGVGLVLEVDPESGEELELVEFSP